MLGLRLNFQYFWLSKPACLKEIDQAWPSNLNLKLDLSLDLEKNERKGSFEITTEEKNSNGFEKAPLYGLKD